VVGPFTRSTEKVTALLDLMSGGAVCFGVGLAIHLFAGKEDPSKSKATLRATR